MREALSALIELRPSIYAETKVRIDPYQGGNTVSWNGGAARCPRAISKATARHQAQRKPL